MKKLTCLLGIVLIICGCVTAKKETTQIPKEINEIKYADIQTATSNSIENLISQDVLKKEDGSKPFVIIDHVDNTLLPHLQTDLLAQDIRLAILMSDKAVTMPAPEKKQGRDLKKETAEKLLSFDFFLTGGVIKTKIPSPDGGEVDCFAVSYKLKDIKTDLVIWEFEEQLTRDAM